MQSKLTVIGSGSSGNSYALWAGDECLLLECGMKRKDMLKGIDYQTQSVVCCLVSHEHKDHCGYLKDIQRYGFPVVSSIPVAERIKIMYNIDIIGVKRNSRKKFGGFTVIPMQVPHDGVECDGFVIIHEAFGKLVFLTDLEYCPYDLSNMGINIALVECNYNETYLGHDVANKTHVLRGHMELKTCQRFIKKISNDGLKNVILIHLSESNGNGAEFQNYLINSCPKNCELSVAYSGLEIQFER